MERLLQDATKLSGVKYDISNLGDVYEAIHVIQGELGLTGVAAQEAEDTFTGSMLTMKASIKNLMGNLALGKDITQDLEIVAVSARTYITKNMLPLVGNLLKSIPALFEQAIPEVGKFVVEMMKSITANADEIRKTAVNVVRYFIIGIVNALPEIISAGVEMIRALKESFMKTPWDSIGRTLLLNLTNALESIAETLFGDTQIPEILFNSIVNKLPEFMGIAADIIENIATWITNALPGLLAAAQGILHGLVDGILTALQDGTLLEAVLSIIDTITTYAMQNATQLLIAGTEMLTTLIGGLIDALPMLIDFVIQMGVQFVKAIVDNFPALWEAGKNAVLKIGEGILSLVGHIPELLKQIGQGALDIFLTIDWVGLGKTVDSWIMNGINALANTIWNALVNLGKTAWNKFKSLEWVQLGKVVIETIVNGLKSVGATISAALKEIATNGLSGVKNINWASLGSNIINGIVSGLRNAGSAIKDMLVSLAKSALNAAKSFLGIKSPSRVFRDVVGKNIVLGMAEGIGDNMSAVTDAMDDIAAEAVMTINPGELGGSMAAGVGGGNVINITVNPSAGMDEQALADMVIQRITFTMQQAQAAWG